MGELCIKYGLTITKHWIHNIKELKTNCLPGGDSYRYLKML